MAHSSEATELTVVVTAHNRADLVEETLSSLADQEWPDGSWEIVLVDNASSDATPEILDRWIDKMPVAAHVISATDHLNPSYSRNCGAAASTSRSIVFVDDDDVLAPGFVAAIGVALRSHAFVASRHEHQLLNDHVLARYRGSFQTKSLGEIFGVPMASAGGFGCRRELWDRIGGHSIETGYGAEDVEFSLRAAQLGERPHFVDDAVYHVRLRGGARASFRQGRRYAVARVRMYRMFGPSFGQHSDPLSLVAKNWIGMLKRLPTVTRPGPRLVWSYQLGRRVGHVQGSIRNRTWYL